MTAIPFSNVLGSGNPLTIARLVVTIMINPPNGMIWCRFLPHIFEKGHKAVAPAFAYLNSSSSVVRIIGRILVKTSILESCPRAVFWSALASSVMAVFGPVLFDQLALFTTTALGMFVAQNLGIDRSSRSTNTAAEPGGSSCSFGRRAAITNDSPVTECLAS